MHAICCNERYKRRKDLAAINECEWHLLSNAFITPE